MEVMEEGDLMDRVPVLLTRDRQYYDSHQTVLQEAMCPGIVGGTLDFPRSASFAAVKLIEWWEDEYYAAYRKFSGLMHLNESVHPDKIIVKSSSPEKFVSTIAKSADRLLEHIHVLSQEALDHADLTVLNAAIGAAALIKNSLFIYLKSVTVNMQAPRGDEDGSSLKLSFKQYGEMTEALAERLLDLHVRLLSLYIIQDADCLHWENPQPFFESERGSYTIQMWWLYIQGTKEDLWNSVPPGMAIRILAGMLNETLTILAVRYSQIEASQARSPLVVTDITNLLFCVAEMLPSISPNGEALAGFNLTQQTKSMRDIHSKCQEMFLFLLLRAIPLGSLYKLLRKGPAALGIFQQRAKTALPWIQFTMPKIFDVSASNQGASHINKLANNAAIALELKVLLNSSQANWSLLLNILLMRNGFLLSTIFEHLIKHLPARDCFKPALAQSFQVQERKCETKCGKFLCSKDCGGMDRWMDSEEDPVGQANYQWVFALTYVVTMTGRIATIRTSVVNNLERLNLSGWSDCLDKHQIWNQKRPPWFEAIHYFVYPILEPIINVMISSMETGSTVYQTMALTLSCITEMLDCVPVNFFHVTAALNEVITTEIRPLGDSVMVQTVFSALYTKLLQSNQEPTDVGNESDAVDADAARRNGICSILGEAICSIDEDHKHTEHIETLVTRATEISHGSPLSADNQPNEMRSDVEFDVDSTNYVSDLLLIDVLTTEAGKKSMKLLYDYLKCNAEWLLTKLEMSEREHSELTALSGLSTNEDKLHLLKTMFHIGHRSFDQLLTNSMRINYGKWFQMPMNLTAERAWEQISKRYEFQENTKLSMQDAVMAAFIKSQLQM